MNYPQNTLHPEIGPRNSVGPVVKSPIGISGSLIFTRIPSSLEASRETIEEEKIKNPLSVIQQKASEAMLEQK